MASLAQEMVRPLNGKGYLAVSPDGREIAIPKELFVALNDFMSTLRDTGSMVVHFRSGGIAGLETLVKKKYK
jgi:hypothetical protein